MTLVEVGMGWVCLEMFISYSCNWKTPSGMCAKLRTVVTSNNSDRASQSLLLLLARARYNGVILHAHPIRGESHNQRNATREFATLP